MSKTKIIAIGGGSLYVPCRPPTTLVIDQEAVRLATAELPSGREKVNVLFIPTASGDAIDYCHNVYVQFALRLGCNYDHLRLSTGQLTWRGIVDKIAWADIIYVGGGNTRDMMEIWEEEGVLEVLRDAYAEGKVLMGLSAGSICWFEAGLSDSNKFDGDPNWRPMWVDGLGFLPLLNCPHLDSERWRREELEYCMTTGELTKPVIALEDNCAIEVVGDEYRILSSRPGQGAYVYYGDMKRRLVAIPEFQKLESLF